jgi:hypothetical protein
MISCRPGITELAWACDEFAPAGWPQHPKTETYYAPKNPPVTPYKRPKYFFWDISRARKGGYHFKNRIVDRRGLLNEASGGKKTK